MVTPRRPKIRRKNKKISSSIVDLFKGGLGPSKSIGLILPKAKARKPRKTAKTGSAVRTQSRAKIKRMKMKS